MVLRKLPLTSENVYSMKTIYDSLNLSVTFLLPLALIQLTEGIISVKRIEKFLLDDCEKPNNCQISSDSSAEETVGISITNASFKWDESLPVNVLNCITFSAKSGELIGVFGASGSGKSTLLQVILKEIGANGGTVSVKGSTSYAPQDPWIFLASIRQNILFGQDLDTDKYLKVIKCCALESDLSLLPNGDQSLVGERGVMLSGGQKARLSLARAIYRNADIYLLDDPLSALDANVARQIFEECVLHYLKDKCVVLVTHQIQYLRNVSKIYILEKGKVVECDKYERLLILKDEQISEDKINTFGLDLTQDNSPSQVKEHRSEGVSNTMLYKLYCNSAGHWLITCVTIFLFVLLQFLINFVDYFLTFWINLEQEAAPLTSTFTIFFTRKNCLYIYTSLLIALIVVTYIANISLVKLCTNASRVLHQSLLTQVIYQPMMFFNQHSSGRILNRFSNDIGLIDELMPLAIANVTTAFLSVMGTFILISVLNYWMILPSIVQIVIVYFLCVVFQPTNTNLRRTEAISTYGIVETTFQQIFFSQEFCFWARDRNYARTNHHQSFRCSKSTIRRI
jgi:ATP-binding cassette subfamily C (CFTR/MRP) protein 4